MEPVTKLSSQLLAGGEAGPQSSGTTDFSLSETIARGFDVLSVGEAGVVQLALDSSNQKGAMSSVSVSRKALALLLRLLLVALKLAHVFYISPVCFSSLPPTFTLFTIT